MANADKIQADYDQLGQIAAQFAQQGDRTLDLGRQVHGCMSQLRDGGWIGVGANRFYNEMDTLVLPGLQRLANALHTSSAQTQRIAQILRAAEEQAGQLFYGGDGNFGAMPAPNSGGAVGEVGGGASSGGMNMGGMIGTMVGGMLGGPLGAMIGGALGNAIGSGPFGLSGRLSVLDVGKSSALSPVKMKDLNYIGDHWKYNRQLGHEFSDRQWIGRDAQGITKEIIDRTTVELAGGKIDFLSHRGAVLRGDLDFQAGALKGNAYGELLSYDTSGKWSVEVGKDGVEIGMSAQAGAYLARTGVTAEIGGLEAKGEAYIGAQVHGNMAAVLQPGQAYVSAGVEAFVGGRAQGEISYQQQIIPGLNVGASASGYVSYGLGAQADIKFGYDDGKIRIGGTLGATLGIGVGGSVDFTIDAKDIINQGVQTAQEVGRSIAEFGRGVFDIGRMFLP